MVQIHQNYQRQTRRHVLPIVHRQADVNKCVNKINENCHEVYSRTDDWHRRTDNGQTEHESFHIETTQNTLGDFTFWLLLSQLAELKFGMCTYSLRLPTEGWPGWVDLADTPRWFTRLRTVTHPSTNRARRRLTSLIRPTTLPTKLNRLGANLRMSWQPTDTMLVDWRCRVSYEHRISLE